jgi:hypothetical protein
MPLARVVKTASGLAVAVVLLAVAVPALQAGMFTKRTPCQTPYAHPFFGYYPTQWRLWPPPQAPLVPRQGGGLTAALTDVSAEEPARSKTPMPPASLGSPDGRK